MGRGKGPMKDFLQQGTWPHFSGNHHCRTANLLGCMNHRPHFSITRRLAPPPPARSYPSCLGETEILLPSETSLSAHRCLIPTSKNHSPAVSSRRIFIWQQLCSVNSFSKNSFHLCWQFRDSISEKGCG